MADDQKNEDLQKKSFAEQNEYWRGRPGKIIGTKPHNCLEYWKLKEYLESVKAPKEITETFEQWAYMVDLLLGYYAEKLWQFERIRRKPDPRFGDRKQRA